MLKNNIVEDSHSNGRPIDKGTPKKTKGSHSNGRPIDKGTYKKTIGENLKKLREARKSVDKEKYSQEAVSEELKVNLTTLGEWERGHTYPSIENLVDLAELYGVSVDFLLGRIEKKNHDLEFICKETGLSENAVLMLQAINALPLSLHDQASIEARKIPFIINTVLEKEASALLSSNVAFLPHNAFTVMYNFAYSDKARRVTEDGESIGSGIAVHIEDGNGGLPLAYDVRKLYREALIEELRRELESLTDTRKRT